jgi:serine/threonine protein phosphatase PrpC
VYTSTITDEDEFIVMASDGLWDVMTEEQVIEFIREWQKNDSPDKPKNVSDAISAEAKNRSSPDNISVVVVFLKEKGTGKRRDKICNPYKHLGDNNSHDP